MALIAYDFDLMFTFLILGVGYLIILSKNSSEEQLTKQATYLKQFGVLVFFAFIILALIAGYNVASTAGITKTIYVSCTSGGTVTNSITVNSGIITASTC